MKPLVRLRFDALAGYSRSPMLPLSATELSWFEEGGEKLLGVVSRDVVDGDYLFTVLGRDALGRFRAVHLEIDIASQGEAERRLKDALDHMALEPASAYSQGDEAGRPLNLFDALVPLARQNPGFAVLTTQQGYSPALGLLKELAHYFKDADGNFVEQFQSTGFDARLWELYLYALFIELGYGLDREKAVPDFHCIGLWGDLFVEGTTVNPSEIAPVVEPDDEEAYYADYVPMKYGSALFSKLQKRYWDLPHVAGHPLVIAIQDFHAPKAMTWSSAGLVEYLYGIRQVASKLPDGSTQVISERVGTYKWQGKEVPAAFFLQPDAEHISAVLANPGGTISKFNRMGFLAGFGDRAIKMVRGGICYRNGNHIPESFSVKVNTHEYSETWCEGVSVYHNPNAVLPLPEYAIPGAAHHSLRDGQIVASMPHFFPVGSLTAIAVATESGKGDPE